MKTIRGMQSPSLAAVEYLHTCSIDRQRQGPGNGAGFSEKTSFVMWSPLGGQEERKLWFTLVQIRAPLHVCLYAGMLSNMNSPFVRYLLAMKCILQAQAVVWAGLRNSTHSRSRLLSTRASILQGRPHDAIVLQHAISFPIDYGTPGYLRGRCWPMCISLATPDDWTGSTYLLPVPDIVDGIRVLLEYRNYSFLALRHAAHDASPGGDLPTIRRRLVRKWPWSRKPRSDSWGSCTNLRS